MVLGESYPKGFKDEEDSIGIVSMDQMNDVWGLTPEVVDKINYHFKVLKVPSIKKIDINNASIKNCRLLF
jgi:hypothetical protein